MVKTVNLLFQVAAVLQIMVWFVGYGWVGFKVRV